MNNFPKPSTIFWSGDDLWHINKASLLVAGTGRRFQAGRSGAESGAGRGGAGRNGVGRQPRENLRFNDLILFLTENEICNQETAVLTRVY